MSFLVGLLLLVVFFVGVILAVTAIRAIVAGGRR